MVGCISFQSIRMCSDRIQMFSTFCKGYQLKWQSKSMQKLWIYCKYYITSTKTVTLLPKTLFVNLHQVSQTESKQTSRNKPIDSIINTKWTLFSILSCDSVSLPTLTITHTMDSFTETSTPFCSKITPTIMSYTPTTTLLIKLEKKSNNTWKKRTFLKQRSKSNSTSKKLEWWRTFTTPSLTIVGKEKSLSCWTVTIRSLAPMYCLC